MIIIVALPFFCPGQIVKINVNENKGTPLTGASVVLESVTDSAMVHSGTTDALGAVLFKNVVSGWYEIKISYVGYEDIKQNINLAEGMLSLDFLMKPKHTSLNEVTIKESKPLITQEDDKMIIDPKPLVGISSNTLEVLESTPGLFVDYETGIYLTSATPAVIYVNGREQKLGKQDIITLLKNLPPGSIEKIEVIRTPSTKYDAASTGGIINIILKKGMKIGRFGNANAGMNQGVYGNRFAGFSLNNSNANSTYYINANYNYNDFREELNTLRYFSDDTLLMQESSSRQKNHLGYLAYGMTYDVTDQASLSYDGRISYSEKESDAHSISFMEVPDNAVLFEREDLVKNDFKPWSINQDIGMNRKFDTLGSEWDTKFSYSLSVNNSIQNYSSSYVFPLLLADSGDGDNFQKRHFFLLQSDLTYLLPYKIKLETGIKSTWQQFNSDAEYSNITGMDTSRTNAFNYSESINAAYLQASRTLWGNIVLKTGCRLEHTYMDGNQTIPVNTNFLVNRADLFPYLYLSRDLPKIMGIQLKSYLIYRKTISRPDYQNLNPYKKYIDPFLYETGNPALKPQFTNNIEFNVSFDDMPIFAIGQNITKDIFSSVVYSDTSDADILLMTYDNLGTSKETYLKGMIGIPPGGAYFFALGAQYNMNNYSGYYEGNPLSYERGSWRFFTFHSLNLFKNTRITLSGFMMLKGQQGFYELDNFGSLNMGITQTFLDKNLMITLNARDVLKTMVTGFSLDQGEIKTTGDRYSDNRRIGLNIRYNFGLGKKSERKGLNGYDDENAL